MCAEHYGRHLRSSVRLTWRGKIPVHVTRTRRIYAFFTSIFPSHFRRYRLDKKNTAIFFMQVSNATITLCAKIEITGVRTDARDTVLVCSFERMQDSGTQGIDLIE